MAKNFRSVNRALGKQPKLGPFPANQIIPLLVILVLSYIIKQTFGLSWINTALFAGWLLGSSWILSGQRSWRFLSKFARVPYFIRCGIRYKPLLSSREERSQH